jgi:excisionase family DNA binding protein
MTLLKTSEVAKILRIAPQTVRKMIREGLLPSYTVGNLRRVDTAELSNYLRIGEKKQCQS